MKKKFLFLLLILFYCKKEDCSSTIETLEPENYTVVVGWPITLNTKYVSATITNKWSGPNNWTATTQNGIEYKTLTNTATFSDAGDYLVESYSYSDCLLYRKKMHVSVIDPPHAPCSIGTNTINISSPFTYQASYTQTSSYISNNRFEINASNGNQSITFTFKNAEDPKPGIHSIYHAELISSQGFFLLDSGQFYVQEINNNLVLSFCNAVFYNPNDMQTDVFVSGEITTP